MCKRRRVIVAAIVVVILLLLTLLHSYLTPPTAWSEIHVGDTEAQVQGRWPDVYRDLHDIKGDFLFHKTFLGSWRLQIIYGPDNRVSKKRCVLRIGTKNNFKEIQFGDSGA
jgi:hypothetical protein